MLDFAIIDAHVHLMDHRRLRYGWTADAPELARDFSLDDFMRAAKPYRIEGFVFVEVDVDAHLYREEADWVEEIAAADPRLKGAVVALPLERGAAIEDEIVRVAARKSTCGVRRLIQHESDPQFALRPDFLAALKLLAKYGLSFDVCVRHVQLKAAIEMARLCPETQFVLDHVGKPAIRDGLADPWRADVAELARLDNVVCKLSGLVTEADAHDWTADQLRPYIEHAIECFGPDRILYGGDWPVSRAAGDYLQWLTTLEAATASFSPREKRKLFRTNAMRVYRLA